ncbi:MAG TPA: S8 family serine peptidase, partial [Phycisphaerae bacterium]|nr:S8 family serine peptidase [Phycisphaerae bacterium]
MRFSRMTLIALTVAVGLSTVRGQQPGARDPSLGPADTQRPQEALTGDMVGSAVCAELERSPDGRAYVVVLLRPVGRLNPARLAEHQAAVREREGAVLGRLAPGVFTVVYQFENIAAMTGFVDAQGLAQLAADPDVVGVGLDARCHATLAESVPFIEADIVQDMYCYTGEGITVAVLDTGIDTGHPDLSDNIAEGAYHFLRDAYDPNDPYDPNDIDYGPGAEDDNGHGTNVAGIITSAGTVAPVGVAPDADILAIKVLDANGAGWMIDVAAAVDYVISVQGDYDRLAVINMSLGSDYLFEECPCDEWGDPDDPHDPFHWNGLLRRALEAARDAGIVSFAASGNDGECWAMRSPACLSSVAAVAAAYDDFYGPQSWWGVCEDSTTYPDLVACFSNRNQCNELSAPGVYITAPGMGGGTSTYTGTSQATPHASGVAALMLEADPRWQLIPCIIRDNLRALGHITVDPCDWNPNPRRVNARRSVDAVANAPVEMAELLASDAAMGAWFGHSVAIDGDVAVIGARLDDNQNGQDAGAAYVFRFDGASWMEEAKLTASDGYDYDEFGWSVAISRDTILVGAPEHAHDYAKCGAVYVFRHDPDDPDGAWPEEAELVPYDGAHLDAFGRSVAVIDDYALIGSPYDDDQGSSSGSVYYYHRSGSNWVFKQKLLASDANDQYVDDRFGISLAMSYMETGPRAVIGADGDNDNGNDAGAAYEFDYNVLADSWAYWQKLLASDGEPGDAFGYSVGRAGGTIVVGAPYDDDQGQNAGSAYIFSWWLYHYLERAKLVACDGAPWDFFGYSVGTGWSSLPPYPVDRVVIGAPLDDVFDDDPSDDSGSAYVFRWYDNDTADDLDDDFWYHQAKLRASDDMPGSCFGYSVAMSGETAVVGAHAHSCMAPGAGAAYVFANPFKDCNGNGYPDWCDIENGTSEDNNGNGIPDECEGEVLTFHPTDDAYVDEYSPNATPGGLEWMVVRNTGDGPWECDALARFDVSSIPPGTTITSATYHLY